MVVDSSRLSCWGHFSHHTGVMAVSQRIGDIDVGFDFVDCRLWLFLCLISIMSLWDRYFDISLLALTLFTSIVELSCFKRPLILIQYPYICVRGIQLPHTHTLCILNALFNFSINVLSSPTRLKFGALFHSNTAGIYFSASLLLLHCRYPLFLSMCPTCLVR